MTLVVLFLLVVIGILFWDLFVMLRGEPMKSISVLVYNLVTEHPILAFVLGVLIGHVLWPQPRR